jgi:NAD(P)-dependent dehydrogenase (short-subunit alcohol dehydrogenase family)
MIKMANFLSIFQITNTQKTEMFAGACSLGRVGEPAEVASAILFLANTEEAGFITGTTLVADGGYAIQTPSQMGM